MIVSFGPQWGFEKVESCAEASTPLPKKRNTKKRYGCRRRIVVKYNRISLVQTNYECRKDGVKPFLNLAKFQSVELHPAHHAYHKTHHHNDGAEPNEVNERKFVRFQCDVL